jgi:hypothetical protein
MLDVVYVVGIERMFRGTFCLFCQRSMVCHMASQRNPSDTVVQSEAKFGYNWHVKPVAFQARAYAADLSSKFPSRIASDADC